MLLGYDQWGSNRAFSEHCPYIKIPAVHSLMETKSKLELMRYESRADMGILQAIRAEKHTLNLNAFSVHHATKNKAQSKYRTGEKNEYYHKSESNASANITSSPTALGIFTNIVDRSAICLIVPNYLKKLERVSIVASPLYPAQSRAPAVEHPRGR